MGMKFLKSDIATTKFYILQKNTTGEIDTLIFPHDMRIGLEGKKSTLLCRGLVTAQSNLILSGTMALTGAIVFSDADGSNTVSLTAPPVIGSNFTLTLPADAGSSGYVLTTDGSGNLSFSQAGAGSGTVTSVAIAGTDGIDIDSGSPITSAGTITLGLSGIPNSSLANDGITIAGADTSLGGSITADTIAGQISGGTVTNSQLVNDSVTVSAGTGMSGGGSCDLGSTVTLNNVGVTSLIGGTGISVDQATGAVTVTNTQSAVGGVVSYIMTTTKIVLAGSDTSDIIEWDSSAATNSNVVSSVASGVFTIASIGEYKVSGFLVVEADTQNRSDVQIAFAFINGNSTSTNYESVTLPTLSTTSVKLQIISAYFNFTDVNTRTVEMDILATVGGNASDDITVGNDKGYPNGVIEITKLS